MALIELNNVSVHYGRFAALQDVTCSIGEGAIGLLGPNGAGKSTLIKTLLGFNRASKGEVVVFGHRMPRKSLEVRQQLGYMPEREVVSPSVSAVSFLTYCGQLFGMKRIDAMERTHEVLNYVGLGESRYRKMDTYSTGMLQRVKLAQALIHDPKLLLLDEPTNGLDPDGRLEMLELIKDVVSRRGVTVILSSHLLPDVQHVCERVVMIARGMIIKESSMKELTSALEQRFEVRVFDKDFEFIQALDKAGYPHYFQYNGMMVVTLPDGVDKRVLFELAHAQGTNIRHIKDANQRLEDVFLEAVGAQ